MTATLTSDGSLAQPANGPRPAPPLVDIVIPVYNEAHVLADSIHRLVGYLGSSFPFTWRVTIADNASTDDTWSVAERLEARDPRVRAVHLDQKGRGRALRTVWLESDATVVSYMDVDLSTDLDALLPLVAPLLSGHSDLAIGSRLLRGSRVVRGPKREFISRTYNRILQLTLRAGFRDAQCGFKAMRTDVGRDLLPLIEDDAWFFDTELLVMAERNGLRIAEIPVDWVDDPDSRVDIVKTATEDLKGVWRLSRDFWFHPKTVAFHATPRHELPPGTGGELVSFATVGVVSTVAYLAAFLALRPALGDLAANAVSLTATMLGNTAAHRRFTFRHRTRERAHRHFLRAGAVHAGGLALTSAALLATGAFLPHAATGTVVAVVMAASALATGLRFLLMPAWVFRERPR